ncbi:deoxynucleoside kinase [Spongiibacter sp. IMCC21906]|jgi:deoxyguanosine kinase|uniref:deoxynucleoside kinase n=1 Tax=Spongiibacter sp. IMCC21906 TaxID=1620392 RepID=UPI00062DFAC9|nr:deoxynucleoside kinase [Spongiibacter sp. IMCC21906]AKH68555.1 deoxynucleoside kinase [Spongiibacter sp. IMCC21906]
MTNKHLLSEPILGGPQPPRFVAVEGPIGVGKTTLAKKLAHSLGYELLLEKAEENPFLERFYANKAHAALSAQLFFLFQRAQQLSDLRQQDMFEGTYIADFLFEKDALFAELTLDPHELELYRKVYQQVEVDIPRPDLVIYLQAPVNVLQDRIQRRGINFEQSINDRYLENVNEAYSQFFLSYNAAPLVIINATEIDFANNDDEYQKLLAYLLEVRSGRHYFNPTFF